MIVNQTVTPQPQGSYVVATRWKDLVFTAGMTPRVGDKVIAMGPVSADTPVDILQRAAEVASRNALAAAMSVLAENEEIADILRLSVYVATVDDFQDHPKVADLISIELRRQMPHTKHWARSAVGVANLPGGALLEIELVATTRTLEETNEN